MSRHGTRSRYNNYDCRCLKCRFAESQYRSKLRKIEKLRQRAYIQGIDRRGSLGAISLTQNGSRINRGAGELPLYGAMQPRVSQPQSAE